MEPIPLSQPQKDRFWSQVDRSGCRWLWTGLLDDKGYGKFSYRTHGVRYHFGSHRIAYWLHHGEWPGSMCVCHTCDTPACVNPSHFFLGTRADNRRDCVQKARHCRGEINGRATLSNKQVRKAVQLAATMPRQAISHLLHIDATVLNNILSGRTWSSITGIRHRKTWRRGCSNGRSILTEEDVLRIVSLRQLGWPYQRIALEMNCGKHLPYQICSGNNWSWLTGIQPQVVS